MLEPCFGRRTLSQLRSLPCTPIHCCLTFLERAQLSYVRIWCLEVFEQMLISFNVWVANKFAFGCCRCETRFNIVAQTQNANCHLFALDAFRHQKDVSNPTPGPMELSLLRKIYIEKRRFRTRPHQIPVRSGKIDCLCTLTGHQPLGVPWQQQHNANKGFVSWFMAARSRRAEGCAGGFLCR